MRVFAVSVLLLTLSLFGAAADPASITISVGKTSPSINAVLPRFGTLYLEVAYRSDQPLRLQARAFKGGKSLDSGQAMNASVKHPAGDGRALVWVSYQQPAQIEEVRITAYDANWKPLREIILPARAQWLEQAATTSQVRPGWVVDLQTAERQIASEASTNEPGGIGGILSALFGMLIVASVPAYFVVQALALFSLGGSWRVASMLPLLAVGPAVLFSLYALQQGSNLWPLTIIFTAPLGLAYLAALFGVRLFKKLQEA